MASEVVRLKKCVLAYSSHIPIHTSGILAWVLKGPLVNTMVPNGPLQARCRVLKFYIMGYLVKCLLVFYLDVF